MPKRLKMYHQRGARGVRGYVCIRGMLWTENGDPASDYVLWILERLSREHYKLRYVHQETGKYTVHFMLGRTAVSIFLRGERKRRQEMNHV